MIESISDPITPEASSRQDQPKGERRISRATAGYCHAEAKSVRDPITRMRQLSARQTTITVLPLEPKRLEYQIK